MTRPDSVFVAFAHEDAPTGSFMGCFLDLVGYDMANGQHLADHGWLAQRSGTDGVAGARNNTVREFLNTDASWLFWLDDDMGFTPDTLERLMEVAHPTERPIVGGLCFSMRHTGPDGQHGWKTTPIPVIYDWAQDGDKLGFNPRRNYPREAVVQCSATGSACVVIHRSVFEKVAEKYLPEGQAWYDRAKLVPETVAKGATIIAEDLSFCMRAASVGCPTFVHTGVKTTHAKTVWLGEDRYLAESWPEPATDRVDIYVPVLGRPEQARPFMESLRASTGLASVYAIAGDDDDLAAWRDAGAVGIRFPGTFARKVNHAFGKYGSSPWVLLVGSDVIFRPGWFDRALRAAGDRFHLVGTNDLSDLVRDLAVHPLIRRSWIEEHGASWDGPGTVAHEGYGHNFVDNEWTAVARQAGVLTYAPDAVVEHMHPIFGKADEDDTYRKGYRTYDADKALWLERAAEHLGPKGWSVEASVAAYNRQWQEIPDLIKVHEDLDRYERIIEATSPEVVVELGTWKGRSALWFATHDVDVITVDVAPNQIYHHPRVSFLEGSSINPDTVTKVTKLVDGRRCMVVCDSDHSAIHVAAEMAAYADLVSPGCYMVVEDGICRFVEGTPVTDAGPLDAIEAWLPRPGWSVDLDLMNLHPVSHHPYGWLRRAD